MTSWGWEMGSPNGLMRRGWTRNSMKIGDVVSVEGSLAKDGSSRANARVVLLAASGERLFAASSQGADAMTGRLRTARASHALNGPPTDDAATGRPRTPRAKGRAAATALAAAGIAACLSLNPGAAAAGQSQAEPAPEPTPRLANGAPNLGRVAGEKGVWAVPYITNMAARTIGPDGEPLAAPNTPASSRGARGGSASEPHIPFMPWSAAIYDYNSANESKYDPEGYCLPPGGPRMMATPYPMEIIQLPEQERIIMIFEGAHPRLARDLHGRPPPPGGRRPEPHVPGTLRSGTGRGTRWSSTSSASTRRAGSTSTAIPTPTNCTSSSGSRAPTRTPCVTRRRSTTRARTRSRGRSAGTYRGVRTMSWLEYICQDNNLYLYHLTDDFGQPIFGNR